MSLTVSDAEDVRGQAEAAPGRARSLGRLVRDLARRRGRWLSPLALLLFWEAGSASGVLPERLLPAPTRLVGTVRTLVADGALASAVEVSARRVLIGFALGAVAALALSVAAGLSRVGENALDPPLQMLRTLPHFGLIPLFILWFGIGESPKIYLIALGVLFPLYLNTFAGIRGTDLKLVQAGRTLGLSRRGLLLHIVLPSALPQALVGLRQSLGVAWLTLIVAEQINAESGIGYLINEAREFLRIDVVVVGLLVYSLLGLLTDTLVRLLERRALSWRVSLLPE